MRRLGALDEGLQPERTILAWRRSALTAACVTVLAARGWIHQPCGATLAAVVSSAFITGTLAWGMGLRMGTYRIDPQRRPPVISLVMLCTTVSLSITSISVLTYP